MKKKTLILALTLIMIFNILNAAAYKYGAPYDDVTVSDELYRNMPTPFSYDEVPKKLVASCDFATELTSDTLVSYHNDMVDGGINEGSFKFTKTQTETPSVFALKYISPIGFTKGEVYAFSCEIKTEGVVGDTPRNILSAYDASSNWLTEAGNVNAQAQGDTDWYESVQILSIPENTEFLTLQVNLPTNLTGTVYFDNFKLYKIGLSPMETVLVSPNYKGLIYGDDYTDINLDVLLYEEKGFYNLEDMKLKVLLTDKDDTVYYRAESDANEGKTNFVFPSKGLSIGDYYLKVLLCDRRSGELLFFNEHKIRKRAEDYRPEVYVDKNGHFIENGEKTFITRLYNHKVGNDYNYDTSYEFSKDAGIDTIGNYTMWFALDDTPEAFNSMREDGVKTHISLTPYLFSRKDFNYNESLLFVGDEQENIPKFFKKLTDDYKDDSVLSGYYVLDEHNPYTQGEEIRWNNEILSNLDINHPTFGAADKEYDRYGIYTTMCDILGFDPYPITGKTDDNGVRTDNISKIGDSMCLLKENFPQRPVYLIQQGFHFASRGDLRSPTYQELRNMAWQAISEGAEGMDWYSFSDMLTDTTKSPEQWKSEVKTLLSEILSYEDVILSDEPAPKYTVSGGGDWLNLSVKRYNGKTYIFAVNNTHESEAAKVNIKGLGENNLSFGPLEVKLLEFEQDDFASPEAELYYMGFSNGDTVFSTVEKETETVVYIPKDSAVINYTASVSENALLTVDGEIIPENGELRVKDIDSFDLCVIAEDSETMTKRHYVFKQIPVAEGASYDKKSYVAVAGSVDASNGGYDAALMLVKKGADRDNLKKDDVGYIGQREIRADGTYTFEFSFDGFTYDSSGLVDNYEVVLNVNGVGMTPTISRASVMSELISFDLDISDFGKAATNITSEFGVKDLVHKYKLYIGFFDSDGILLDIKNYDKLIEDDNVSYYGYKDVPENAVSAKAFLWDSSEKMIPLAQNEEIVFEEKPLKIFMIGNSLTVDAARYLENLTDVGGLDLKYKIKAISAGTIEEHAANLDAELNGGRTSEEILNTANNGRINYIGTRANYTADYVDDACLSTPLKKEKFDVVVIQTYDSNYYGFVEQDFKPLGKMVSQIRSLQPDAEIVIYEPWLFYVKEKADRNNYYLNHFVSLINERKENVPKEYDNITPGNRPLGSIPVAEAFYEADNRDEAFSAIYPAGNENLGDLTLEWSDSDEFKYATGLYRDVAHASYYGCYLCHAVWYEFLTGRIAPTVGLDGNAIVGKPDAVDDAEHKRRLELLSDIAHEVMQDKKTLRALWTNN